MADKLKDYLVELDNALKALSLEEVKKLAEMIYSTSQSGNTVYVFGNGDSANNAFHLAADLSTGTIFKLKHRIRILCLNENVALFTAWANDYSFEEIFKIQLQNLAKPGDLVIGITISGNSPNVLRALEYSNGVSATTYALTAFQNGKVKDIAKHSLLVKTDKMEVAEAVHWVISDLIKYHLLSNFSNNKRV